MYYLYVLQSLKADRKYIGISQNAEKRIIKHNNGGVRSTKAYRPWKIVYLEEFMTKKEARIREILLKKNGIKRSELFKDIG